MKFFEIDLPHASHLKRQLVDTCLPLTQQGDMADGEAASQAASGRPCYIAADLAAVPLADALEGTGFDPSQPTFFSCQGLVYYVSAPHAPRPC